jgi:hypothetical protein
MPDLDNKEETSVTTFWEEHRAAESDPSKWLFLTAAQRQQLLEDGIAFDVTGVSQGSGKYGREWQATITAGDTVKVLSFAHGCEGRDHKLAAMQAWLADRPFGVIRCQLVKGSDARPDRRPL